MMGTAVQQTVLKVVAQAAGPAASAAGGAVLLADPAVAAAKKKPMSEQVADQTRASTILTQGAGNPNALGG